MNLKQELKELAVTIRQEKSKRKELKGFVPGLDRLRFEARHKHVAYSLIRGNELDAIEKNPKKDLDLNYVKKLMEAYNEAICANLQKAE
jgi:hypothetical protein